MFKEIFSEDNEITEAFNTWKMGKFVDNQKLKEEKLKGKITLDIDALMKFNKITYEDGEVIDIQLNYDTQDLQNQITNQIMKLIGKKSKDLNIQKRGSWTNVGFINTLEAQEKQNV